MKLLTQLGIILLHLILLAEIIYALNYLGQAPTEHVFYHFLFIAIYASALIRFCAYLGKKQAASEQQ